MSFPAASIPLTLQPAGLDKSAGFVTAAFLKEPGDPTWKDDPEVAEYLAFRKKYSPEADPNDWAKCHRLLRCRSGGASACGDELTRDNLMFQATHMDHVHLPMLLLGITSTRARPIIHRLTRCSSDASTAPAGSASAALSTASRPQF